MVYAEGTLVPKKLRSQQIGAMGMAQAKCPNGKYAHASDVSHLSLSLRFSLRY